MTTAVKLSDSWLTPPALLALLGAFDLDPCSPVDRPWPTAAHHYTIADDGLVQPWFGRVFLNPPYSKRLIGLFMAKMADHGHGTALVNAATDTKWFFASVWERAHALLFLMSRVPFVPWGHAVERTRSARSSVLIAYGEDDMERLHAAAIDGAFVPLASRRQVVAVMRAADDMISWAVLLERLAERAGGTLTVAVAYVLVGRHPKIEANPHWQAKVRQVLQGPKFKRVARGTYEVVA